MQIRVASDNWRKSYIWRLLSLQIIFYNEITSSADKEREVDVVSIDFNKAFDIVSVTFSQTN